MVVGSRKWADLLVTAFWFKRTVVRKEWKSEDRVPCNSTLKESCSFQAVNKQ